MEIKVTIERFTKPKTKRVMWKVLINNRETNGTRYARLYDAENYARALSNKLANDLEFSQKLKLKLAT